LQGFDDRSISRRKLVLSHLRRIDPPDFCAIERRRPALSDRAAKEVEFDDFFRVLVPNDLEGNGNSDANAQLLIQFPLQALFKAFSLLTLSAGKLPQTGEMHACSSFGDEITAVRQIKPAATSTTFAMLSFCEP
jgi:hypothetical protein